MKKLLRNMLLIVGAVSFSEAALAYVGPGAGLSLLGALWGLLIAVGAALLFLVMWPIRRMRKRKREQTQAYSGNDPGDSGGAGSGNDTDAADRETARWESPGK
ncbi:hypothetical protein [Thiohalorhabdus methylotrophus]|uniref:Uncharacterized protein n=1 Tax=Thiohalorhabdus methylotrophus TaxID=3242694 RepID=A0ABV4TUX2_9GAMM